MVDGGSGPRGLLRGERGNQDQGGSPGGGGPRVCDAWPTVGTLHSLQDRAYLTATEWKQEWGGHKAAATGVPFKSLPFHCCAISFQPFEDAVSDGRGFARAGAGAGMRSTARWGPSLAGGLGSSGDVPRRHGRACDCPAASFACKVPGC